MITNILLFFIIFAVVGIHDGLSELIKLIKKERKDEKTKR